MLTARNSFTREISFDELHSSLRRSAVRPPANGWHTAYRGRCSGRRKNAGNLAALQNKTYVERQQRRALSVHYVHNWDRALG